MLRAAGVPARNAQIAATVFPLRVVVVENTVASAGHKIAIRELLPKTTATHFDDATRAMRDAMVGLKCAGTAFVALARCQLHDVSL